MSIPYFIYLDSKIVGAAKQICVFFDDGIFSRDHTEVLIKKYKHKSAKQIQKVFKEKNISYRFVLAKDVDDLQEGVVFYPFNAQSNCRVVANRKLKHIFITHGESNKVASVKPIIRIYDYVATAGQAGIDRFLANGIFTQCDVDNGRLVTAGDTFIGKTGLSPNGKKCILYAPTWEGGIEAENYSSLSQWQYIAQRLLEKAIEYHTDTIIIRPHPNIGHRLTEYKNFVFLLAKTLKQNHLNVIVFSTNISLSWWQRRLWTKQGVVFFNRLQDFQADFAICDVSAIETQLLNEGIAYEIFVNDDNLNALMDLEKTYAIASNWLNKYHLYTLRDKMSYKQYLIDESFKINSKKDILNILELIGI